jgi:hypothetical protein
MLLEIVTLHTFTVYFLKYEPFKVQREETKDSCEGTTIIWNTQNACHDLSADQVEDLDQLLEEFEGDLNARCIIIEKSHDEYVVDTV